MDIFLKIAATTFKHFNPMVFVEDVKEMAGDE
jgi:hypothetical protein